MLAGPAAASADLLATALPGVASGLAAIEYADVVMVTIAVPENAGFYAALAAGIDSVELYWDFVADEAADNDKTRCLARGRLLLMRTEQ